MRCNYWSLSLGSFLGLFSVHASFVKNGEQLHSEPDICPALNYHAMNAPLSMYHTYQNNTILSAYLPTIPDFPGNSRKTAVFTGIPESTQNLPDIRPDCLRVVRKFPIFFQTNTVRKGGGGLICVRMMYTEKISMFC